MITIRDLSRNAGTRKILSGISLDIPRGKIFTIIGPSGSGKTSLLRVIDLLDVPDEGAIVFDGIDTSVSKATHLAIRRRMAMVFQKPTMLNTTVERNVAFGLKFRGVDRQETAARVSDVLGIVGLPRLAGRRAVTLSGGEIQRVAIARALVTRPEVLLLDEPTANLDPINAELIENLIIRINREFKTTIILSTHDMIQGQRLADRMGVIMDGRLAQVGSLHEIFYKPAGQAIARFVGIDTVLHGWVQENVAGLATISVGKTTFEAPTSTLPGQQVVLFIRPEEVTISPATSEQVRSSIRNHLTGTVAKLVPFGPFVRVTVDCGFSLTALITRSSCKELGLTPGSEVRASVKASAIHVMAENS